MKIVGLAIWLFCMIVSKKGGNAKETPEYSLIDQFQDVPKVIETKNDSPIDLSRVQSNEDPNLFKAEEQEGDPADNFGINQHKYVPYLFPNVGRRFVAQYPYRETLKKSVAVITNAEEGLDKAIQEIKKNDIKVDDEKLIPKRAPPVILLAAAEDALKKQLENPEVKVYKDKSIQKEILRNGEYWDNFWVEKANPDLIISQQNNLRTESNASNLNVLRVKIMPGSRLHDIVSVAKQISPRLLYIINTNKTKRH